MSLVDIFLHCNVFAFLQIYSSTYTYVYMSFSIAVHPSLWLYNISISSLGTAPQQLCYIFLTFSVLYLPSSSTSFTALRNIPLCRPYVLRNPAQPSSFARYPFDIIYHCIQPFFCLVYIINTWSQSKHCLWWIKHHFVRKLKWTNINFLGSVGNVHLTRAHIHGYRYSYTV